MQRLKLNDVVYINVYPYTLIADNYTVIAMRLWSSKERLITAKATRMLWCDNRGYNSEIILPESCFTLCE
jgi:hypothetical protein